MTKNFNHRNVFLTFALAAVLATGLLYAAQDAKPFVGDWKGAISVMGQELEIACHFTLDENGAMAGTFDSPLQGAYGLALGDIKIEGKKISFMILGVPGDPLFAGELDAAGTKIAGSFTQGGAAGTFSLEKEIKK